MRDMAGMEASARDGCRVCSFFLSCFGFLGDAAGVPKTIGKLETVVTYPGIPIFGKDITLTSGETSELICPMQLAKG